MKSCRWNEALARVDSLDGMGRDCVRRVARGLPILLLAVTILHVPGSMQHAISQQAEEADESDELVQLSTTDAIPLSDLIEYASERLGVTYLYDPGLRDKEVNLIARDPIPLSRLEEVIQNVLLAEGLIVSDPDITGVRRISSVDRLSEVARPGRAIRDLAEVGAAVPVTKLFELENSEAGHAAEVIRPFLSQSGASIVVVENRNAIIITDAAENVRRAAEFIQLLDAGDPLVGVRFVEAEHVDAQELASQLREVLEAKTRVLGGENSRASGVQVAVNSRTNELILIGKRVDIEQAVELLESLDRALPTVQEPFSMEFITPERFDEVMQDILAERQNPPPYQARPEGNVLIIDSTQEVLELAERVLRSLDTREAPVSQSPIRFYKIKNVPLRNLSRRYKV
jgi:general secretion pathway protein D